MRKTGFEQAIRRGLSYIGSQQLENGGLASGSSASIEPFRTSQTYYTTFAPALVLSAISKTGDPAGQPICKALAGFLQAEQNKRTGAFNYWARKAKQHRTQPYPDDLDDTFCALSALYTYDPKTITEKRLAQSVRILTANEAAVGGPYRTWLAPARAGDDWQDIDIAVNANIAYFLSLVSNPLPKLQAYLDKAVVARRYTSPYYPSAYPIVYYVARGYSGTKKALLVRAIRELLSGAANSQEISLCLAALGFLGSLNREDDSAYKTLLAAQADDGSWPAAAFCLDPVMNGRQYYNGAPALTTAFAIEALTFHHAQVSTTKSAAAGRLPAQNSFQKKVMALAANHGKKMPDDLRRATEQALQKIAAGSNGVEIIALAPRFAEALQTPRKKPSENFFVSLSLANLYGWLAYTIYDDFIDEEGTPALLPVANTALRSSVDIFTNAVPKDRTFGVFAAEVFDVIDAANAWELTHCRLPVSENTVVISRLPAYGDLSKLAERSLGHCLSPLAVLAAGGCAPKSLAFRRIKQAFIHYLIAKQLNDDVHDWQEDLARGHCTYVVTKLLQKIAPEPGQYERTALIKKARRQFWHHSLQDICAEMQRQTTLSRQALDKAGVLSPDNIISELLDGIEASVQNTLEKQSQASGFLHYYGQEVPDS